MLAKKGQRFGGRQKGTPNKIGANVKAALEEAFVKRGGVPALLAWAEKEPTEFYRLWGKLLPLSIKADIKGEQVIYHSDTPNKPADAGTE